jgi:hypothetical protein
MIALWHLDQRCLCADSKALRCIHRDERVLIAVQHHNWQSQAIKCSKDGGQLGWLSAQLVQAMAQITPDHAPRKAACEVEALNRRAALTKKGRDQNEARHFVAIIGCDQCRNRSAIGLIPIRIDQNS